MMFRWWTVPACPAPSDIRSGNFFALGEWLDAIVCVGRRAAHRTLRQAPGVHLALFEIDDVPGAMSFLTFQIAPSTVLPDTSGCREGRLIGASHTGGCLLVRTGTGDISPITPPLLPTRRDPRR